MVDLLDVMAPRTGHRQHIFSGHIEPTSSMSIQTANMALRRMGYDGKLVAHGLRSLASTILNKAHFQESVLACLQT